MNLKGKRILFFTASFMGFQFDIKKCLDAQGAKVEWFDERMSDKTLNKIIVRLDRDALSRKISKYYNDILNNVRTNHYDYVLFVNIEAATRSILMHYKEAFPDAKFILYEWDSIRNQKNAKENLDLFDIVWTFDRNDSKEYGIRFLPLFYLDKYARLEKRNNYKNKILFVGTTHSDRYRFIKTIEKQVCKNNEKSFLWFYFPSKLLYYKMWFSDRAFRSSSRMSDFRFSVLNEDELLKEVEQSEIIVDAQHPKQTGLTMRTIEALGSCRKLITTNADIENYDFYNPHNILLVDRINPVVTDDFLNSRYEDVPEEIYRKYSLTSWVKTIFGS